MLKEHYTDERLTWEVLWQGLDGTSGELVNVTRIECEHPSTFENEAHFCVGVSPI